MKERIIGAMRAISEYDSLASIKGLYDAASDVDLFYSKECHIWSSKALVGLFLENIIQKNGIIRRMYDKHNIKFYK